MPRIQMSIKPSYNMTPNQRKMVAQRRNVDTEVVSKSGKKLTAFIFVGIGFLVIASVAGYFVFMNDNGGNEKTNMSVATDLNDQDQPDTNNISENDLTNIDDKTNAEPENENKVEPLPPVKDETQPNEEINESVSYSIEPINPNTKFAQDFFGSLDYIVPEIPKQMKSDILSNWAADAAKFSSKWRDFSNKAKSGARWGISRKASEIADDWGYLAEFFTKDVTPDDREHLRNIVSDIINRETTLKQQCEN